MVHMRMQVPFGPYDQLSEASAIHKHAEKSMVLHLKHRGQLKQGHEQVQRKTSVRVIIAMQHVCLMGWQMI